MTRKIVKRSQFSALDPRRLRRGATSQLGSQTAETLIRSHHTAGGTVELLGQASVARALLRCPHSHSLHSRTLFTSNLRLALLLMLAGDIEPNPGPTHKYTCGTCSHTITSSKHTKGSVLCNITPTTDINDTVHQFNHIILDAAQKHIPKGNRTHHNPNFTHEIKTLIKQREKLRHSPNLHSEETTSQIRSLNTTINHKIHEQKTNNWHEFVNTLIRKTNTIKLYRTLKSIALSNSNHTRAHEAITTNKKQVPSNQQQANTLVNHYARISHLLHAPEDRSTIRRKRKFTTDPNHKPFTYTQTKHILRNLKTSSACGPDGISNIHLKHLGPHGIQTLTNISNHSYAHNTIPHIWKQGTITTIPKPNKDPTLPSSHRPITLLCTPSKITERLMLQHITPHIQLSSTQHGFRSLHSTTTLLTNLTQTAMNNINTTKPPHRTLLVTLDISQAFDTVPRHKLSDKILNTQLHNNTKRWLTNYLAGRCARVS